MWDNSIIFVELLLTKTVHLGSTPINFICHRGMGTLLHSCHFQILLSFTSILHSTWHIVPKQAPVPCKDFQVMGHIGKDITSTKMVMAGLKCSPLPSCQDNGCHLKVHQKCPQHRQEQYSHSANMFHLYSSTRTSWWHTWTFIWCTWQAPAKSPNNIIAAARSAMETWYSRVCEFAPIAWAVPWRIYGRWWEQSLVELRRFRRQSPKNPETHKIILKAMCHKDAAAQLQFIQQVEESMGG